MKIVDTHTSDSSAKVKAELIPDIDDDLDAETPVALLPLDLDDQVQINLAAQEDASATIQATALSEADNKLISLTNIEKSSSPPLLAYG